MGFMDNWSWSDTFSALGTAADLAGTGYDIYQSAQAGKDASAYNDVARQSLELQNAYNMDMYNRTKNVYWPYEDLNYQYATEDIQTLRPLAQAQARYTVDRGLSDIAKQRELDPLYDETEKSLIRKLTEGEDVLKDRLMSQATADIASSYGQQRESDARTMAASGINPNSGQYQNYLNRMGSQQALAEASARTSAGRTAEDLALSRQAQALNYRRGSMLSTYNTTPTIDTGNISSGLGNVTSTAGNLAANASNSAQLGLSSAYSQFKDVLGSLSKYAQSNDATSSASSISKTAGLVSGKGLLGQ